MYSQLTELLGKLWGFSVGDAFYKSQLSHRIKTRKYKCNAACHYYTCNIHISVCRRIIHFTQHSEEADRINAGYRHIAKGNHCN